MCRPLGQSHTYNHLTLNIKRNFFLGQAQGDHSDKHFKNNGDSFAGHQTGSTKAGLQSRVDKGPQSKVHKTESSKQGPQNSVHKNMVHESRVHKTRSTKQGPQSRVHKAGVHKTGSTKQGPQSRVHKAGSTKQGPQSRAHKAGSTKQGP